MPDQKLQEKNTLYAPAFSDDWNDQSLYPLAEWLNGMAFKDSDFVSKGKPIIKIAEIKNGISGQTRFTNEVYDEKYLLKKGDMLFCWSGQPQTSIDIFWWDGPEGWLNQHTFKVTPKIDNKYFFFYLLKYLKPNFVQIAVNKQTTGLGHVTKGDLERFVIKLPTPAEQCAIASVLSSLDDKIELLREQNKTLEATAQAIFKEWFVNFNFPGSTGKMIDSDLGQIPEGWMVEKLGNINFLTFGDGNYSSKYPKQEDFLKQGVPFISNKDIKDGIILNNDLRYISAKQHNNLKKGHLKKWDILISTRANIGDIALVPSIHTDSNINAQLVFIRPNNIEIYSTYLYLLFRSNVYKKIFEGHSSGSAQSQLPVNALKAIMVIVPNITILKKFSDFSNLIIDKSQQNSYQIQTLSTLRNTLLPKLMKGNLRVVGFEN